MLGGGLGKGGTRLRYLKRNGKIVWATPPRGATDDVLDAVLAELEAELRRGSPYVLLFDLTDSLVPSATQRQKLAAHMRDNKARIRLSVLGVGVVQSSALVRGVVTAIFWIAPPEVPHRVFSLRSEAVDWARSLTDSPRR
jgi:hypothetical protein